MAQIKWLCCVLFILVMLSMAWHGRVSGQTKKDDTYLAQQGIRSVKEFASIMGVKAAAYNAAKAAAAEAAKNAVKEVTKEAGKAASKAATKVATKLGAKVVGKLMKVASFIGKLAPMLGVAGFLIPMIMGLLGGESGQMKFLRAEFFKVNEKLDKISDKLDKLESKVTFENQRAAYIKPQETIKFSYGQMKKMIKLLGNVTCEKVGKKCKRKKIQVAEGFLKDFEGTEAAMHTIFQPGGGSVFKEPLIKMFRKNYDCHIPLLADTFKKLQGLSRKAQMVVNMKEQLSGSEASIVMSTDIFMKMMYKFRQRFYDEINECRRQMLETNKDTNLFVKDIGAKEEKPITAIKQFFEDKYSWLKWVSILIVPK